MARLNEQANEQRQKLTAKQKEVHAAMKDIESAMEAAGSRKTEVEALSAKQAREHESVLQRKVRLAHRVAKYLCGNATVSEL